MRASYAHNPVAIRNNEVAKLIAATNAKMGNAAALARAPSLPAPRHDVLESAAARCYYNGTTEFTERDR
jgi:hypothetical protein